MLVPTGKRIIDARATLQHETSPHRVSSQTSSPRRRRDNHLCRQHVHRRHLPYHHANRGHAHVHGNGVDVLTGAADATAGGGGGAVAAGAQAKAPDSVRGVALAR